MKRLAKNILPILVILASIYLFKKTQFFESWRHYNKVDNLRKITYQKPKVEQITNTKLLTIDTNIQFKHLNDIQVFQYFDNDSNIGKTTHSIKLDSNGLVMIEYFKDYKTDKGNGREDVLTTNEYNEKKQLIIATNYYESFENEMVEKSFFYYKDSLLVRMETFELKKRLKPNIDKGFGRPGGCIILAEDYEKESTWKISQIVLYEYDGYGRKISSYSPIFKSSHNRFEYEYNTDGILMVEKSFDESSLLYTINYQYQLNHKISNLQWNNKDWKGTKKILEYDNMGNIIKETVKQNGEEFIRIYKYNIYNKLERYIAYDSKGKISLTHIYKYAKK